jgi:hypothetical protein
MDGRRAAEFSVGDALLPYGGELFHTHFARRSTTPRTLHPSAADPNPSRLAYTSRFAASNDSPTLFSSDRSRTWLRASCRNLRELEPTP